MSKKTRAPEIHMVGLVPDSDGNYLAPNFKESARQLVAFIQGRGEFLGMLDTQGLNHALVNVTDPTLVDELREQSFVERVPLAGSEKDIGPFRNVQTHKVDEEKIGAELTL